MENFVLNLFSDQLSKIILDFSSTSINANFLSGKGSIKNVKLNVDLINEFLNKPPHGSVPFLEFTEITLTELRVEVTSYTNLKKAPIVLVIEEIHAKAREPLEYHVDPANVKKAAAEKKEVSPPTAKRKSSQAQQYGLLHRILDNLSIKIKRIHLSFSSLGKFKTRRRGIWTPPTLQVCFDNVEWISVTETGNTGTPDNVWAHNELSAQQSRFKRDSSDSQHRHRSYVIYKRLSMLCHVKLLPLGEKGQKQNNGRQQSTVKSSSRAPPTQPVSTLISDTKVDVHIAYVRRLRDAGVTGADMDVKVHDVDINLDVASYNKKSTSSKTTAPSGCDLGAFVHMLVGFLHCYYKDRSFIDPLLPEGVVPASNNGSGNGKAGLLRGFSLPEEEEVKDEGEEVGPDDYLPEVALMDDDLDSSDESDYEEEPDEEHDEAFLAWKREQGQKEGDTGTNDSACESSELPSHGVKMGTSKDEGKDTKSYKRKRKAVIVVASGAQKFEKLSFSLSIPRINMKLCLPSDENESKTGLNPLDEDIVDSESDHHCLELLLEGLVAECIWPKNQSGEMGGHVQGSIKYCHILESAYQKEWGAKSGTFGPKPWNVVKILPLLRVGTRMFQGHDAFSLSPKLKGSEDIAYHVSKCDEFPLMEDRQTTWRWDRKLNGPRALAFKSTVSFVDETLTRWSKTNVQHEASLGELEVVLNSAPIERLAKLFSNPTDQDNLWFDSRWLTGEWHAEIATDMIAVGKVSLKNHLQPLPSLIPSSSKHSAPTSELRTITAHLDTITVRLPNPMQDLSSFRMADVLFSISDTTILVSSDLPSSFLSGVVTGENTSHDFPHDPSDISSIATERTTGMSTDQVFRMQMSLSNCSLKIIPVHTYSLDQDERAFSNLIAPTNVTMMMSLEHKNAQPSQDETDQSIAHTSRSLILSLLVQTLESNVELRSIYGALETFQYHAERIQEICCSSGNSDESIPDKSMSAVENIETSNTSSIICIHVPELEIKIWGERAHKMHPTKTPESQQKHALLCRVTASQFEFGMEFLKLLPHTKKQTRGAVYKCVIASVLVEICSEIIDDNATIKMVEILSMGGEASDSSHLVEKACAFCFPNKVKRERSGFFLRSEKESVGKIPMTSANAVEIASPLAVDLNMNAIEKFLNILVECLVSPVFVGSRNHLQIGQTPLGSAMYSICAKLYDIFSTPSELIGTTDSIQLGNSLFRMSLDQLLLLVPSTDESEGHSSFGLSFTDVEIAVGESQCNKINLVITDSKHTTSYPHITEKNCGHGGQTWLKAFHLLSEGPTKTTASGSFYALKSNHSMLRVVYPKQVSDNTHQFNAIFPASSINWSLPVGLAGSSSAPPFDVFAMKDLSFSLMNMGMPLSSLYFKLYKLSPQNKSAQSDLAATRLLKQLSLYHGKMHSIIGQMNAEVERLKRAVFSKENERVGALALASPTCGGWVRVGEDLSFSHRIFSSATFWRYWMVLDKSLLILYKAPGTSPSYIIPLRASSQLRSLSMSSSSNKTASGIVGNHMQQKGFAVFDAAEGTELFFVATNDSDYKMWVQAISLALKKKEITAPDNASSTNLQALPSTADHIVPLASSSNVDPFGVIDGMPTASAPPLANDPNPFREELEPTETSPSAAEPLVAKCDDSFASFDAPTPVTATQEEILPASAASMDSFEAMDDVEMMEEISLGENDSPMEIPSEHPSTCPPIQEPRNINSQALPMRERLALAKGKSKIAKSKFGSALKTAKGGMLAAGEIGRDGIKQAAAKEALRREEPTKRSLAVGQKMSMLKRNASTKLTAARSSMQDHISVRTEDSSEPTDVPTLPLSSSRDELSGNRKLVVGQKIGNLKKNASTKLTSLGTSVRTSMHDQSTNLDLSSTMRRLKIDEKVTQFSAAVKSSVKNDPVMRQISNRSHSRNNEHSKQRLGIGEESKSIKPIKFDARETFFASSDLPVKVKSIRSGEALLVDDNIFDKVESLQKIEGNWVVSVNSFKVDAKPLNADRTNHDVPASESLPLMDPHTKPFANEQVHYKWQYKITVTDMNGGLDVSTQASVERAMSEMLSFHTHISEIIANKLPSTADIASQEGSIHAGVISPVFEKLSPIDRLRVSATLLRRVLEINDPSVDSGSSTRDNHCELIKVFISTLLECHMPEKAISATKVFLNIEDPQSKVSDVYGTHLISGTRSVDEAFAIVSDAVTPERQPVSSQANSVENDPKSDQAYSSLLKVIMDNYTKAMKERDEALASLATTSIINDNKIMQEQLRRSNGSAKSQVKANSSDEDILNLCKQLGNEIALRTAAQNEINRLNEQLEFDQKIAKAKENELRTKLEQCEKSSQNAI